MEFFQHTVFIRINHWAALYCFCGMKIPKLMDTFKNQFNFPTGNSLISFFHMESILTATQFPHKLQLIWHQTEAWVQDFTILVWCKWGWDAWVVVSGLKPLMTILFNVKTQEQIDQLSTTHTLSIYSVKQVMCPMQKWKMGGTVVHSYPEWQLDVCCRLFG